MTNVKYTIRGMELLDINPEFVSDLERVTSELFHASVSFPDFNAYEESVTLMHGVTKTDGVHPESPWAKARFRFDKETRIDSLQGVLINPSGNEAIYVQLDNKVPEMAAKAQKRAYDSNLLWKLNEQHVEGKSVESMAIDRGREYDSMALYLSDGTKMVFLYKQGTFIGFEIDETTGQGIKSAHYILEDVDPSVCVPGFLECLTERKDVVFMGGTAKPLLAGSKVFYRKPYRERVKVVEANNGDQHIVLFEAESMEKAQSVCSIFRESFEDESKEGSQMPFDVDALAHHLEPSVSVNNFPRFAVDLTRDRKSDSGLYGLTMTTLSTGCFETQNDLRDYIKGSLIALKTKTKTRRMELL